MQRGFIPILIVILVAALVGGYFVYSKSQTQTPLAQPTTSSTPQPSPSPTDASPVPNGTGETANWKTYTSKLGFSIKYPDDISLASEVNRFTDGSVVLVKKGEEDESMYYSRTIQLDIYFRGPSGTSALKALKNETPTGPACENAPIGSSCNPKTEVLQFNNLKGLSVVSNASIVDYYMTDIDQSKPALRILLMGIANPNNDYNKNLDPKTIELFKKIIGTLRY